MATVVSELRIRNTTFVVALLIALTAASALSCGGGGGDDEDGQPAGTPSPQAASDEPPGEFVVFGAEPVAFDFTPDGRLFFTLREQGEVRWVALDRLGQSAAPDERGTLFATIDAYVGSECGLLGIAVDPEYAQNHYVYVYVTQPDPSSADVSKPRVLRLTDVDGHGSDPTPIVDDLPLTNPTTCAHVGGNLHFGPDGYLYVSVGNNERAPVAHDLSSPLGKILRINKADGSAAPDNPFLSDPNADPRVFAYGFRNPWDFAFHPDTGRVYAPDNGQGLCDELNIVDAGKDYGVPASLPPSGLPIESCLGLGGVDPVYLFAMPKTKPEDPGSNVAPAGVAFSRGGTYAGLGTGLLVCEFNTKQMHYLEFEGPEQDKVRRDVVLARHCPFNVKVDGAGIIYYSVSKAFDTGVTGESGIYRLPPATVAQLLQESGG